MTLENVHKLLTRLNDNQPYTLNTNATFDQAAALKDRTDFDVLLRDIHAQFKDIQRGLADYFGINAKDVSPRMALNQVRMDVPIARGRAFPDKLSPLDAFALGRLTAPQPEQPPEMALFYQLEALYQEIFGRAPDIPGMFFWAWQVSDPEIDVTIEDIPGFFRDSDEGQKRSEA